MTHPRILAAILLLLPCLAGAQEDAGTAAPDTPDTTLVASQILLLGPLPPDPAAPPAGLLRGSQVLVPEIEPGQPLPADGQDGWRLREAGADGRIALALPGIYWVGARLRAEGRADAVIRLDHGSAVYGNGEELNAKGPGEADPVLETAVTLDRGWTTVFARIIVPDDDLGFGLAVQSDPKAGVRWTLERNDAWTRFADTAGLATIGSLAVADQGRYLARRIHRRSEGIDRLDLFDGDGYLVAADACGSGARPLRFLPGDNRLLVRRGSDLLLWAVPAGAPEVVLKDEPGLGFVKIAADGKRLLFASDKGFDAGSPAVGPGRRYTALRERIADFAPGGHLHLFDLETGLRRILTRPGDFVLDDAVFTADGRAVIYGRTLPQAARPWFFSEIRRIDLAAGTDELLAVFTSGWEVRPGSFAAAPDGRTLVFLGPPAEIGDYGSAGPEHNVYNKQVWILDLDSAAVRRLTQGESFSFDGGGGTPAFDQEGRLLVRVTDRSGIRLVRMTYGGGRWTTRVLPQNGDSLDDLAVSPDAGSVVYTGSSPDAPEILYLAGAGEAGAPIEDPNEDLGGRIRWSPAESLSFTGPGGETIDAWLHPPLVMDPDGGARYGAPARGKAPLIVYYYGGSAATLRTFSTTFQFLAANGYAVLVVNPRGAAGWGEAFADHHAGDWGPLAAADVMAATSHALAERPYLDGDRVGIYGGSYGGFLTNYLVTHTDMYAAAVSMYGISDLATYWGQGAWGVTYGDMALGGRNPWGDPGYFTANSPLFRADQVRTPLLLLHGQSDANVTPGESAQLFTALSVLDRPVEMVTFPGEDHGISGSWDNRVAHRTMMLEWFDRWLRDRPDAWEARWK